MKNEQLDLISEETVEEDKPYRNGLGQLLP